MAENYDHTYTDQEYEDLLNRANDLHRACERKRGSIRGQVIEKEDSLLYFVAVAARERAIAAKPAPGGEVVLPEPFGFYDSEEEDFNLFAQGADPHGLDQYPEITYLYSRDSLRTYAAARAAAAIPGPKPVPDGFDGFEKDYAYGYEKGCADGWNACRRIALAAAPANAAAAAVPEGWALLPRTITADMCVRFAVAIAKPRAIDEHTMQTAWDELIAAAPQPLLTTADAPLSNAVPQPAHNLTGAVGSLDALRAWSLQEYGEGPQVDRVVGHIRRELAEVEAAPNDLSEWVDVITIAADGAMRAGYTPQQIIDGIAANQVKLESRQAKAQPVAPKMVCGAPRDGRDRYPECDCEKQEECQYGTQPETHSTGGDS
jgi:hypothetical protein